VSVFLTYALGLLVLSAVISMVVIPFADQIGGLVKAIPDWIKNFTSGFSGINFIGYTLDTAIINGFVTDIIGRFTMLENFENIAGTVGSLFSSTALLFACLVFSIYLVIDHDNILEIGLVRIVSDTRRERVKKLILDMESKVGKWLLGQALVSSIAGIVTGVSLAIIDIPFALPMGVFVALMSAVPTLGATIGAIPPIFVALVVHGPITALIVFAIFFVYQQVENNLIIPKIMGNVMGVRPIFVMFAAVTFFILFGVWGAVLAVPVIVIVRICYEFYIDLQKLQAKGSI
jgi:predicted PurR-regulated permease PerM